MGGFMIYSGERAIEIGLYNPNLECHSLDDTFGRSFIFLSSLERRLAAQQTGSSDQSSPTWRSYHITHSLAALEYIKSKPAEFASTLERVEKELHLSIGECIEQVEWFNKCLNRGGGTKRIRTYYEREEKHRLLLEGILIFLETLERHNTAVAHGRRNNADYSTVPENEDETTQSISGDVSNLANQNSRLRNLVPRITEQDIQDKSKNDALTKIIALLQVVWFIIQLVVRHFHKLAITQLETVTLAFCILHLATYAVWRKKPYAVDRGYAIRWTDNGWDVFIPTAPPFVDAPEVPWYQQFRNSMGSIWRDIKQVASAFRIVKAVPSTYHRVRETRLRFPILLDSGKRVPDLGTLWVRDNTSGRIIAIVVRSALVLIFGYIHWVAWDSGPTGWDKFVWKVCSVSLVVLSFIFLGCQDLYSANVISLGRLNFLAYSIASFYGMARLILLYLVVRSLVYCPQSALEAVPWSQLIPHV